jgi:endonuclease YncB( thermonuclease family)
MEKVVQAYNSSRDAIIQYSKPYEPTYQYYKTMLLQNQTANNVAVGIGTLACYFLFRHVYKVGFRRIRNIEDVRQIDFDKQRILRGVCVHVGDGDNFRVFHKPLFRFYLRPPQRSNENKLSAFTLHVRLAGMDAPECAHFGMPGQPMGEEVKAWLSDFLTNKKVTIQLLRKDQYSRAVSAVYVRVWWYYLGLVRLNVSRYMLQKGFGVAYEGEGEIYVGGSKEKNASVKAEYKAIEEHARKKRLGMWKDKNAVSPRDHKKKYKK